MGTLERRLRRLEDSVEASREVGEETLHREVLRRMTDDELRAHVAALKRWREDRGFAEEDAPTLRRWEELAKEVAVGHKATP